MTAEMSTAALDHIRNQFTPAISLQQFAFILKNTSAGRPDGSKGQQL
jgi:hypothetical protein